MLSILLAIRIFLEILNIKNIPDSLMIIFGLIIVTYMLIALFYTFRYRYQLNNDYQGHYQRAYDQNSKTNKTKAKIQKKKSKK